MLRRTALLLTPALSLLAWTYSAFAMQAVQTPAATPFVPEDHRPPLFLRETWTRPGPGEPMPLNQSAVAAPNVDLQIYGQTKPSPPGPHNPASPAHGGVEVTQRPSPKDDPTYLFFGPCFTPCAIGLRDRNNFVDLTGLAKIKWRTKQSGFHNLRPILKLADGTWLVGDYEEGPSTDWREREFSIIDVRWHYFDANSAATARNGGWVDKPDLSKVDEIGFTDLVSGNIAERGHGTSGASRIDWIEVYGNPVKR